MISSKAMEISEDEIIYNLFVEKHIIGRKVRINYSDNTVYTGRVGDFNNNSIYLKNLDRPLEISYIDSFYLYPSYVPLYIVAAFLTIALTLIYLVY